MDMSANVDIKDLKGCPTILVVDDEDLMREVVSLMIEENGGKVIEAVDGRDGVDKYRASAHDVACVVVDFSMPGMNGYEVLCEIRQVNPHVPVIMVSGLQLIPEVAQLLQSGAIAFLQKPFHERELIETLQQHLQVQQ